MKNRRLSFLISISVLFLSLACSVWIGDKRIVGKATATRPVATSTPLVAVPTTEFRLVAVSSSTPTLFADVTALQSLNVRKRAGEDQEVAGYVFSGDSVILTGNCEQGWAEIVWGDGTAWVNADYLSENKCSE